MRKVLVVYDEVGVAEILGNILVDAGYLVETAAAGEEARRCIAAADVPDVVILDLKAPGPEGLDLLRALRSDSAWAAIPIVLMSSLPEEALAAPAGDYAAFLRKPFRVSSVLAAVHHALRRSG